MRCVVACVVRRVKIMSYGGNRTDNAGGDGRMKESEEYRVNSKNFNPR